MSCQFYDKVTGASANFFFPVTYTSTILTAMTTPTPASRVTIARPSRSNGVLSIPASATQKRGGSDTDGSIQKTATTRLKIVIRRLPPGMTKAEFEEALGDDWRVNKGKVDWAVYKEGKVSREYGNTPEHLAVH